MGEQTPEEVARAIIPPNYRAETAPTTFVPIMDLVLSSRCAGALRDAIAAALTAYGSSRYAAGHRAGQEEMRGRAAAYHDRLAADDDACMPGIHMNAALYIRALPIKEPSNG